MATNSAPLNSSSTQNKSSPSPSPSSSIQSKEEVEKVFNRFATNGDGMISVTELGALFSSLGSSFSDEDELRRIMDELDSDHDGFISLNEFDAFCRSSSAEDGGASELRDAFKLFDPNHIGLISVSMLKLALNDLGMNCSVEDCQRMIRSVDSDGDGNVNFEEFQKLMNTFKASNSNAPKLHLALSCLGVKCFVSFPLPLSIFSKIRGSSPSRVSFSLSQSPFSVLAVLQY